MNPLGYDVEKWGKRIQYRTDLSGFVYHLTKSQLNEEGKITKQALDVLLDIISERKLNGSTTTSGFITGNKKAVCFQDAPISGICQNVVHEKEFREELGGKTRYVSVGLAFPKGYIYRKGGRPVFYEQKSVAKKILPSDEWWRIVDYDLSDKDNIIDWTHEREWRMPVDEFHFDLSQAVIILPNPERYNKFISKISDDDLKAVKGIIQTSPLIF
ncbi:DUF2971 domain-containing protein [Gottfriedia acidiceleris]|uniref:DUF2971 domain-containing protein n=1 Tax=Gottfriedia acidiceleris TaxID=371036 RepID=UPI002FFDB701